MKVQLSLPMKTPGPMAKLMLPLMAILLLLSLPNAAFAQTISVPFVTDFACSVVQFLKGPMAVIIFVLVVIVTLVFGMITKMKWEVIITVCILFGVVIGVGGILGNSPYIAGIAGISSCLQ